MKFSSLVDRHFKRVRAGTALAVAVALLGLTPAANAATTSASAGPDAQAPSMVSRACGSGVTAAAVLPAAGFDPLTATDGELLANNLPARPTDPGQLKVWTKFVSTVTPRLSCDFHWGRHGETAQLGRDGAQPDASNDCAANTGCDSSNWAGNVAVDNDYVDAYGSWELPRASGPTGASSSWVGIGQGLSSSQPIIQAGSESDVVNGVPNYYLWVEEWPEQNQVSFADPGIRAGDTIWVHIHFDTGDASMTIMDESTGVDETFTDGGGISNDNTAEWVYERTEESGAYPPLAAAAPSFTQAQAGDYTQGQGGSTWLDGVGNTPHYWHTMWNCRAASDTELAKPDPITDNGTAFSTTWLNAGSTGSANCPAW